MTPPRKILIDTDPGVDDAMAIFLALASPELELLGLTTVFGNVQTDLATTNALRLLEIAGHSEIPVAQGARAPLVRPFGGPVPFIHGEDGQGNTFLPPPQKAPLGLSAAQFIIETVLAHPGEVTLVPVGPLTNLALALRLEPRLVEAVAGVVLMGGNALVPGNASPAAEANIHNDPEAADVVLGAGWEITMVGLDVTQQVLMTDAQIAALAAIPSAMARHLSRIVPFYREFARRRGNWGGIHLHDPTAILYLLHPELFTVQRWPIRVETVGVGRGKTWPNPQTGSSEEREALRPWQGRPPVGVCVGIQGEALVEIYLERLRHTV
ncbi:MAG: nucleoside hydrolase [Thermaceae bacterium]|nr:nucleoside hydrolase [Thermaceae bacterium]